VKALVVAARARKIVDFMVFLEICLKFVFRLLYFDRFEICGKDFFFPQRRFLSSDLLKRYEPYHCHKHKEHTAAINTNRATYGTDCGNANKFSFEVVTSGYDCALISDASMS